MDMPWEHRAAIFLKAADLLAGPYRHTMNAATMLAHSKNVFQAEIDCVCELVDFWRFNAHFMQQIYSFQPESSPGMWNRTEHRPLEGFIFAVTPFNFVSINGNLPTAPAMMGNVALWKPASTAVYTSHFIMRILMEAGLPAGVINLILAPGAQIGELVLKNPHLAGIHFTGSTAVFHNMWKTVGANIAAYKNYPRIVGETGGKDFIVAHPSADPEALRHRHDPRRLRVSGAEVFSGFALLHRGVGVAEDSEAAGATDQGPGRGRSGRPAQFRERGDR